MKINKTWLLPSRGLKSNGRMRYCSGGAIIKIFFFVKVHKLKRLQKGDICIYIYGTFEL